MIKKFIHQFASPKTYLFQVERAYKFILYFSIIIYIFSLVWGLLFTQEDFVQGNSYRIIYLHVPASFLSQSLYIVWLWQVLYISLEGKARGLSCHFNCSNRCLNNIYRPYIRINLGNTYLGYLVAMGCTHYVNFNSFYNVPGLNFISYFIQ